MTKITCSEGQIRSDYGTSYMNIERTGNNHKCGVWGMRSELTVLFKEGNAWGLIQFDDEYFLSEWMEEHEKDYDIKILVEDIK